MSNNENTIKYLPEINSPADFKKLPDEVMKDLAGELREELVRVVSSNGGHLASNLGVVELTMAIHKVFDTPKDHVIFDVGHQSYVHKMLTGRYSEIDSIRQAGGISGFTKRDESEHDCFGTGHSSTSLSAALGFAISDKMNGSDAYTVAVVGDGAYTGGMIHEALNNCRKDLRLIIVMNENEMSISKNTGRFAANLSKLRSSSGYFKTKKATALFLKKIPLIGNFLFESIKRIKIFFKNAVYGSNYFENMGLTYLGPIDGNDYDVVSKMLLQAKKLNESVIVHIKTQKGKGYEPAENAPCDFHSMTPNDVLCNGERSFSKIMGDRLVALGVQNENICAVTAAMSDGTGLDTWSKAFPHRFFDVGIAEEHALTFAAGLAANGMKPCVAIYSTFLQRGYDNIIHDIALQRLPVVIMVDRAGLNAKDGATHHGIFDVAFLSHIPNLTIYTPITENGLISSMNAAFELNVPCAIRYPSGHQNQAVVDRFYTNGSFCDIGLKTDYAIGEKKQAMIVTHGRIVLEAMKAADELKREGIDVGIVLLEMLKPYDIMATKLQTVLEGGVSAVLFLEEEIRSGGMGQNMSDKLRAYLDNSGTKYDILATDDSFVCKQENGQTIYSAAGIDKDNICLRIKNMI